MKITIIETGRPPGPLGAAFPHYPAMLEALLAGARPGLAFESVRLLDGEAAPDPAGLEAIVITGSPFGVYDDTPWMDPLRAFVRAAFAARIPMAGICFGHQIIADAMGGRVAKSEKGWGIGRHAYEIVAPQPWMEEPAQTLALAVSHQDQVLAPPPNALTFARSAHTDHAGLVYQDAPVLSLQGHPEFENDFAEALYTHRAGKAYPHDFAAAAIASLAAPHDNAVAGRWIANFFELAKRGNELKPPAAAPTDG